jgi:L-ribulokinase
MDNLKDEFYPPISGNQKDYKQLFTEFLRLYDYFGRGENNVMKTLRKIKVEVKHGSG